MPDVAEIEEVVTEAKKTFDLSDRLKGRKRETYRTGAVTVYTDEATGDALGGAEDEIVKNALGIITSSNRRRWGALGQIDAIVSEDPDADIADLRDQAIELRLKLEESALTFHLRGVPEIVNESARREARKAHAVNGKVPAGKEQDFLDVFNANVLSDTIFKVVDADGSESDGKLTVEGAAELKNFLPVGEYAKLMLKLEEVQFKQAIGDSVTASVDF